MTLGAIPKFNFVPEKQLTRNADPFYRVTITATPIVDKKTNESCFNNSLLFNNEVVSVWDLKDKFIRFYGDKEKKTVGWSILDKTENMSDLEGIRQFKPNPKSGICLFSIKRLLTSIGITIKERRKNLIVQTYKSPLQSHTIYYIKLD